MAEISVVKDISLCEKLWQEFSPKESLFDLWDFRLAFHLAFQAQPHFILLKDDLKNIGLLPLQYETDEQKYFWFGGWWQEDNKIFATNPSSSAGLLFSHCPEPVSLTAISQQTFDDLKMSGYSDKLSVDESKYILDISGFNDFESFLMSLKKNYRHNLRKDRRHIEGKNPKIIHDNFADLPILANLSKKRFEQKIANNPKAEHSIWQDNRYIDAFGTIINNPDKNYQVKMITIKIDEQIVGVDLIAVYNNCYYPLICGYDVENQSGIGSYFNILEIEEAIKLKMKKVDFLQNNCQWKDQYLQAILLYKYEK